MTVTIRSKAAVSIAFSAASWVSAFHMAQPGLRVVKFLAGFIGLAPSLQNNPHEYVLLLYVFFSITYSIGFAKYEYGARFTSYSRNFARSLPNSMRNNILTTMLQPLPNSFSASLIVAIPSRKPHTIRFIRSKVCKINSFGLPSSEL
jgi:hypothetical protein